MHDAYPHTFRAEAVALAREKGSKVAAQEKGVDRRTVDRWMHRPELAPIIEQVDLETGDKIIAARDLALGARTIAPPHMCDVRQSRRWRYSTSPRP